MAPTKKRASANKSAASKGARKTTKKAAGKAPPLFGDLEPLPKNAANKGARKTTKKAAGKVNRPGFAGGRFV